MIAAGFTVRVETPADEAGVRACEERAFGRALEARLVDDLRRACPDCLSLVAAAADGSVTGHLLFSPVTLDDARPADGAGSQDPASSRGDSHGGAHPQGMGLGPLAVLPELQRQGIGSALVEHGLAELRAAGCPYVVVVGHPSYYPRFGFVRASSLGLVSHWDAVPDEAWMAFVLDPGAMAGVAGVVRHRPEFDAAAQ